MTIPTSFSNVNQNSNICKFPLIWTLLQYMRGMKILEKYCKLEMFQWCFNFIYYMLFVKLFRHKNLERDNCDCKSYSWVTTVGKKKDKRQVIAITTHTIDSQQTVFPRWTKTFSSSPSFFCIKEKELMEYEPLSWPLCYLCLFSVEDGVVQRSELCSFGVNSDSLQNSFLFSKCCLECYSSLIYELFI